MHLIRKISAYRNRKEQEKRPLPMSQAQRRFFLVYMAVTLSLTVGGIPVFVSSDPLAVVNNLSDFVFSLIRAIGLILLGFGIVQIGLSLKSQDPSQRANGFLTLANSEFIVMLNQSATDRDELVRLLNISENQLGYITNVKAGSGLIRCSGNIVPFENNHPKDSLYRLMTTTPGESLLGGQSMRNVTGNRAS